MNVRSLRKLMHASLLAVQLPMLLASGAWYLDLTAQTAALAADAGGGWYLALAFAFVSPLILILGPHGLVHAFWQNVGGNYAREPRSMNAVW